MADNIIEDGRPKCSGISYLCDNRGVEIPQKFTTIQGVDYPLIDSKNIDWNASRLTYIDYIKPDKINDFVGGDERTRYTSSFDFDPANPKKTPVWLNSKEVNYSTEVIDIVDYLISRCVYLDAKVDELEANQNKRSVVLVFDEKEINELGAKIDNAGNISTNIVYTLKPNQTNELFGEDIYVGKTRSFIVTVYTQSAIQEQDIFSGPANGIQINRESSVVAIPSISSIIGAENVILNENQQDIGIFWRLTFEVVGWPPRSPYDNNVVFPDSIYTAVNIQTAPNLRYNASETRTIPILVKKDDNDIDYLYINDERYFYIAPGVFNILDRIPGNDKQTLEYYFVAEKSLKNVFGEKYSKDFENYTDEQINDIKEYLVGNPDITSSRLFLPDDTDIEIKIFPKYFGISDESTGFMGSTDVQTGPSDTPSEGSVMFVPLLESGQTKQNISIVSSSQTKLDKTIIDNKQHEGFGWKGSFRRIDKSDTKNENNSLRLNISTTATYYVGKNSIDIGVCISPMKAVKFVDNNYNIDVNRNHTSLKSTVNQPIYQYKNERNFIKSDLNQEENIWNLTLPIYSIGSWNTSGVSDAIELININKLELRDSIPFPTAGWEYNSAFEDQKYSRGLPLINIDFRSGESGMSLMPLITAYAEGTIKNTTDGSFWYDVTRSIEIDYESTFLANATQTANGYITNWDNRIQWEKYNPDLTLKERGKILSDFFVTLEEGIVNGVNRGKYLLALHTTLTDTQKIANNIPTPENYPFFNLVLHVPENNSQVSSGNNSLPLYAETKLYTHLRITRALNETNKYIFTGWAHLFNNGGFVVKNVQIGKEVDMTDLINSTRFETLTGHTVQTRSTSPAIPNYNIAQLDPISELSYFTTPNGTSIYFSFDENKNKLVFTNTPTESTVITPIWQFNQSLQIGFPVIQQADYWFEQLEERVEVEINRQMNNYVDFRDILDIQQRLTTSNNFIGQKVCNAVNTLYSIAPFGQTNANLNEYNGKYLAITLNGLLPNAKLCLGDILTGLCRSTTSDDGYLEEIYGKNWKTDEFIKTVVTIKKDIRQQPVFWTDRPGSMTDILGNTGADGRYGQIYNENESIKRHDIDNFVKLDAKNVTLVFDPQNFAGYCTDSYIMIDILLPMTTTFRGLCMKLLITAE